MHLVALGLNHHTAPLALRDRIAFPADQVVAVVRELKQRFPQVLHESAILSTCNRTEIYGASQEAAAALQEPIAAWLADIHRMAREDIAPHLYALDQQAAVRHAFRVASGLDSMVIGEPQILGQMKQAARDAEHAGALGTFLHQLFQRTFSVAKDVRTHTGIGQHSVSMAAAAVRLAERIFERIAEQRVLFVGAGEMIELCATHFAAQGPRSVVVANRTVERGAALAARFGGHGIGLADLAEQLPSFDIVVSCTGSSLPIIGLGMVERAIRKRRHKPIFMVDLAVPRDIEAEVARLDDVFLYTVDDLGKIVATANQNRQAAIHDAEIIIDAQVGEFMQWLAARGAVPAIRALHERAEQLRVAELERARRLLARGEDPAHVLEALSTGLTNKFLHGPTKLLHEAPEAVREQVIDLVEKLYRTGHR